VAWVVPDELPEPEELDEAELPVEPVLVELELELEPPELFGLEPVLVDPVLVDPVPVDPVPVEPRPGVFVVAPELVPAGEPDVWAEPGRVAATAPVASTLATPAPAVTVVSRRKPRRLRAGGVSGLPSGLVGIGGSSRDDAAFVSLAGCTGTEIA
jgi:hypothetical protein